MIVETKAIKILKLSQSHEDTSSLDTPLSTQQLYHEKYICNVYDEFWAFQCNKISSNASHTTLAHGQQCQT